MMKMPENELFYCKHIFEVVNYKDKLDKFVINRESGAGLERYLKDYALQEELHGEARTYLVIDKETEEIVAYFSLKAGMVSVNERLSLFRRDFDSLSGIELSNFAVNDGYKEVHQEQEGIGMIVFTSFVLPIVKEVAKYVGVYLLYVFALPYKSLINYYEKMNFKRLPIVDEYFLHQRMKPRYDSGCIFMSQKI